MKYSLKKRINALSIEDLQDMSHRSVCRLTDGFKEPYIRYIVARESTKQAQKDVLNILKTKKREYDKEHDPLKINPIFWHCPQFFDDMEFDIDCNQLIDNDGIIEPVSPEELEDIKKEDHGFMPTIYHQIPLDFENAEEEINYLKEQIESSCKTITDLQEEINRLRQENKELEERYSISEEQLDAIFPNADIPSKEELKRMGDKGVTVDELISSLKSQIAELQKENEDLRQNRPISSSNDVIDEKEKTPANAYEKIIFFANVLSTAYSAESTNQLQLSELICLICGGKPSTFQPRISKLANMVQFDKFDEEALNAAKKLIGKLKLVPKGGDEQNNIINGIIDGIMAEFRIK